MESPIEQRHIGELMASRGFLSGCEYDAQVTRMLNELVACGAITHDQVAWTTLESRSAALEAWNKALQRKMTP